MIYLGIDIECNRVGTWNIGIAFFTKNIMLQGFNIYITENFSDSPEKNFGEKYLKSKLTLARSHNPIYVRTKKQADDLICALIRSFNWGKSFGYNSNTFDLPKLAIDFPWTAKALATKEHIDLMPAVTNYLVQRKAYKAYWGKAVMNGFTPAGNPQYAKFSAELVVNYLYNKDMATWKHEEHIGVEDLRDFEYPILQYFQRLKKKRRDLPTQAFMKW